MASPSEEAQFPACDRSDVWAFGLVIWEMLTGDVPHTATVPHAKPRYRAAIGTRPPLPPQPPDYGPAAQLFTDVHRAARTKWTARRRARFTMAPRRHRSRRLADAHAAALRRGHADLLILRGRLRCCRRRLE